MPKASRETQIPPELEDVANQIGDFIEYWGFKKIHGRIWTHIFLSPTPLDAGQLIERLKVSKALVSMSISDLMDYDVIHINGKNERGKVAYSANPDIMDVIRNVLRKRERRMLSQIAAAARLLESTNRLNLDDRKRSNDLVAPERATTLLDLSVTSEQCLDTMLALETGTFADLAKIAIPFADKTTAKPSQSK